jgi:hypothetical protein
MASTKGASMAKTTGFARVEVKPSRIPGSGNGTFALEDIDKDKFVSQYWGTILSETEADEKKLQVLSFSYFVFEHIADAFANQGIDRYIKRVHAFCYDCAPTVMRPLLWWPQAL